MTADDTPTPHTASAAVPAQVTPDWETSGSHPGDPYPIERVRIGAASSAIYRSASADPPVEPGRPTKMDPKQLGFTPQSPVPWLNPVLLAGTAVRVVLATLFGAYLDKRELQNALPGKIIDERPAEANGEPDDQAEVWFDFVADLGDGFDPTYSIAYLLAQESITVEGVGELPRGRLVVMGGDQVYPTASGQQYEDRLKGPYRAAMPLPLQTGYQPSVYALPGNHDWYDGLTAFLRLFARAKGGKLGGWHTRQSRSYFAVQLPHRWWVFAIDAQPGAYLDDPQLRYFQEATKHLLPGDRVILCTPTPAWVERGDPKGYDTIDYFVRKVIAPAGADVRVMLSGDWHHYARYTNEKRELITQGGGGAYLYGTHKLPKTLTVPPKTLVRDSSMSRQYRLAARYPKAALSRWFGLGVFFRLPWRNPGFVALIGFVHMLLMLAMSNAAQRTTGVEQRLTTIPLVGTSLLVMIFTIGFAMPHSSTKGSFRHWVAGILHGAAHLGLGALGSYLWLKLPFFELQWPRPVVAALLLYTPVAGLAATMLVCVYLVIASGFRVNFNELYSSQSIVDAKGFLRMHIGADGTLTIHPLAVRKVSRRWIVKPNAEADRPWFEPRKPIKVTLAEPPIKVS